MRLAIDVRALAGAFPTGVGNYTRSLIEGLVQRRHSDDDILGWAPVWKPIILPDTLRMRIVHQRVPSKLLNSLSILTAPFLLPRDIANTDFMLFPNLSYIPRSLVSRPYALIVHDCSFDFFSHYYSLKGRWWHQLLYPKYLLTHARKIIAVSETTANDLSQLFGLHRSHIAVLSSASLAYPNNTAAAATNMQNPYMLMIGTIEPRKNVRGVIDAFAAYHRAHQRQARLHLVIVGPLGYQGEKIIRSVPAHVRIFVHYLGYRNDAEITELLAHAHALLYPSFYEGFGFPPLHALRMGIPIIAAAAGALPEILRENAHYVDPRSVAQITKAIELIATQQLAGIKSRSVPMILTRSWSDVGTECWSILKSSYATHWV